VYRKIVHDHDIAALECGNETLLYVSEKHRSIDGPFEHEGGDHRAIPQPGHERDCFPLSVPRVADQPLSTQAATSQPHHAGGRACLAGWLGGLAQADDIPLSDEAVRFYKSGPPFLHDYFPFWIAALLGKIIILLIPILGVLYPMMRFLPRLYDWAMRSKVLRMYGELRLLEDEMTNARDAGRDTRELRTRLDRLEEQANHLRVPAAYASMLYVLRNHIDLVREGLRKHTDKAPEGVVARSE